MTELLKSKKFQATLIAFVSAVLSIMLRKVGLQISDAEIAIMLSPFALYVLGQSVADVGKSAAQISATSEESITGKHWTANKPTGDELLAPSKDGK